MRIEPICRQCNMYIVSLSRFVSMLLIKLCPCFSIEWMCKVITVSATRFVPSHLLRRFLGHVHSLDLRYGQRYRRTLTRVVRCVFGRPSPESTSMYQEALHFGQCMAFSWSFLNKTHPFRQACIFPYGILSARRSFWASYMFLGKMWSSGSMSPKTVTKASKHSLFRLCCYFTVIRRPIESSWDRLVCL
jgi:hypothetical protein